MSIFSSIVMGVLLGDLVFLCATVWDYVLNTSDTSLKSKQLKVLAKVLMPELVVVIVGVTVTYTQHLVIVFAVAFITFGMTTLMIAMFQDSNS